MTLVREILILSLVTLFLSSVLPIIPTHGLESRAVIIEPIADAYVCRGVEDNTGSEQILSARFKTITKMERSWWVGADRHHDYHRIWLYNGSTMSGSFKMDEAWSYKAIDFRITNNETYVHMEHVSSGSFSFTAPKSHHYYLIFDYRMGFTAGEFNIQITDYYGIDAPIFLLFDLSSIPPDATIMSAIMRLYTTSEGWEASTVNTYFCSNNDWDEHEITFSSSPMTEIDFSSNSSVQVESFSTWYNWTVTEDVVRVMPHGELTEVVIATDGGDVKFSSRETSFRPLLEVTYDYVSVESSVEPVIVSQGQSVLISVSTNPPQAKGTVIIQYSTDRILWQNIVTSSGGLKEYVWTPPTTGLIFILALWSTSWTNGSYTAVEIVSFNVDATPPSVSITSPTANTVVKSTRVEVTWSGSDEAAGIDHYEIRIDDGPWINAGLDTNYTFVELTEESHTVVLKAVDKVGISSEDSVDFMINTSLIGEPGWIDDTVIIGVIIVGIISVVTYHLKTRKSVRED